VLRHYYCHSLIPYARFSIQVAQDGGMRPFAWRILKLAVRE
jgi:hypothetical protein